jgi:hypothetical protein
VTKLERVLAALKRQPTDRPPYAFWRHFPDVDRNPAALAQSTLRFHERYQSDFLKVTPNGGYAVADWGCVESEEVLPDGRAEVRSFAVDEARHNVAAFGVFSGTHTGEGGPVPPTGKRAKADYVYVMDFDGDKISHMTKIWHSGMAFKELGWA